MKLIRRLDLFLPVSDGVAACVALELSFDAEGPSASLSYDFNHPNGSELHDLLRRFFLRFGLQEKAIEECMLRSLWEASEVLAGNLRMVCRHAELRGRETYEVQLSAVPAR